MLSPRTETLCGELQHILYRQKEQFSDGVGYSWIDGLKDHAACHVSKYASFLLWSHLWRFLFLMWLSSCGPEFLTSRTSNHGYTGHRSDDEEGPIHLPFQHSSNEGSLLLPHAFREAFPTGVLWYICYSFIENVWSSYYRNGNRRVTFVLSHLFLFSAMCKRDCSWWPYCGLQHCSCHRLGRSVVQESGSFRSGSFGLPRCSVRWERD